MRAPPVDAPTLKGSTVDRPRASKDWVVPDRPKPGRKPAAATDAVRSSQRACRERKQEYVSELEAKVRRLEEGDGEKAVLFQQAARQLKHINEGLMNENRALRQLLEDNEIDLPSSLVRKSPPTPSATDHQQPAKRARLSPVEQRRSPVEAKPALAAVAPPQLQTVATTEPPREVEMVSQAWTTRPDEPMSPSRTDSGAFISCGHCEAGGHCLCADVDMGLSGLDQQPVPVDPFVPSPPLPSSSTTSVPIKLRKTPRAALPAVWAVEKEASAPTPAQASCNGDPKTCLACRDDPFGQAFCSALSTSVCSTQPCASCPNATSRRNSTANGTAALVAAAAQAASTPPLMSTRTPLSSSRDEPVACSEAWQELRAHPNIAFADLRMLADVVARRTTCDGPSSKSAGEVSDGIAARRLTVERSGVKRALEMLDNGEFPRGGAPGGEKA